ncbi:MAG: hypothetical protein KDD29_06545 [Flavobacteriales bacterium]|nr:hypothetical protein [Flavobacteriales bacterium]MCB9334970.1 3-oxoacyl-ACP synthase [Flavobacteriales bacterium]
MNTKYFLYKNCQQIIENRIKELSTLMQDTQESANSETKSTAGDKHETAKAMAQLETEKLSVQLAEAFKLKDMLQQINLNKKSETAGLGSLVKTNKGSFYTAVSLGKVTVEGLDCFVISAISPIGKLLLTKKEKESFSFNGVHYIIEQIL